MYACVKLLKRNEFVVIDLWFVIKMFLTSESFQYCVLWSSVHIFCGKRSAKNEDPKENRNISATMLCYEKEKGLSLCLY